MLVDANDKKIMKRTEAKQFIKKCGLLIKNVKFIDEPIIKIEQYNDLYELSKGSISGDGYCFFYDNESRLTGRIHVFSKEIEEEVFNVDNMPIGE